MPIDKGRVARRSKARGYYVERKLCEMLGRREGNYVFRTPVSGSRSSPKAKTAFPDVFVVNNFEDFIAAFEVKSTNKRKIRVSRRQLVKLLKFLDAFKKYRRRDAVVAVWFFRERKWVFKKVKDGLLTEDLVVSVDDESDWSP